MTKIMRSEYLHTVLVDSCQLARLVQGDVQRGTGESVSSETQKEARAFWLRKYSVPKTIVPAQDGQRSGMNRDKTVLTELGFPHLEDTFVQIDVRPVQAQSFSGT